MASLEEIRAIRLEKLKKIKDKGIDPYPAVTNIDKKISDAIQNFDTLSSESKKVTLGGRIMSMRPQGALIFMNFFDGTGTFQSLFKKEDSNEADFTFFADVADIGDFVEFTGTLFKTRTEQQTIQIESWRMLSKSLRPMPEKWHGLQDVEERMRRRYLDLLFNQEERDLVIKKARFWQATREFMIKEGFLEVETPILETTTGGADAKPFATHHNALDLDVFLRISAGELWQKRLMVAGFPRVFEIGRVFRNEGMSAEHLQDYSQIEFYMGYADYKVGMDLVKRMYQFVAQETFGTLKFVINGMDVDLGAEWKMYDYTETIKSFTNVDIRTADLAEIESKLRELKVEYKKEGFNKSRAIDQLWKFCRRKIAGPGFLINEPKELSPLAKSNPDNPEFTQRFHVLIAGSELGNGYSELNDPIDQAERFAAQDKLREAGDDEAQMNDHEFVEALEYGMPPTCGFGMSERVFAFLANRAVRDAQIFPLMKPRE